MKKTHLAWCGGFPRFFYGCNTVFLIVYSQAETRYAKLKSKVYAFFAAAVAATKTGTGKVVILETLPSSVIYF